MKILCENKNISLSLCDKYEQLDIEMLSASGNYNT